MAVTLKIKRATRAQLNTAASGSNLVQGEPYLITDENRIAVGLGTTTYETYAKESEDALKAPLASPTFTGTVTLPKTVLGESSFQLDAALSADGKWSGITETGTVGASTLAFGDLCYFNVSTSKWDLAKADVAATSGGVKLGMCVLAGAANAATEMLLYGKIMHTGFPTLTIGAVVYASAATAGAIVAGASNATTGQPSGADNVIRIVGYGNTASELFFSCDQSYMTHT